MDADACPVAIREILFKATRRTGIELTLVANQPIPIPRAPKISMRQVAGGFDVADQAIIDEVAADDLVITSDIPLASEVIDKGAAALSPRGELFTKDNIRARLNMRDFLDTLRASGVDTGGPSAMSPSDRKAFAGHLDRIITRALKGS